MNEHDGGPRPGGYEKFPRNDGPLEGCNGHARLTGPCGETMEFWLLVRDGVVARASFVSDGCTTSHACGSMAAFLAETEVVGVAAEIGQQEILDALGGLSEGSEHCALLAANALKGACEDFAGGRVREGEEVAR